MKFLFTISSILICILGRGQIFKQFKSEQGIVVSEGTIENGKPNGFWKNYYQNGNLKSKGNRLNYKLDSTWSFYNSTNKLVKEINYQSGLKNGLENTYNDSGILISSKNYIKDTLSGNSKIWYPTGELFKVQPFKNNLLHGKVYTYQKDSTIISIEEYQFGLLVREEHINRLNASGKKTGIWKSFTAQGRLESEGSYKNGEREGIFKTFKKDGSLNRINKFSNGIEDSTAQELMFVDLFKTYYPTGEIHFIGSKNTLGKKHGIFQEYAKSGDIIKSYVYKSDSLVEKGFLDKTGLRQKTWFYYFPGKLKRAKGKFKNDLKTGKWTYFYIEQQIEQEGSYKKGLQQGVWKWFHKNGAVKREETYLKGKLEGNSTEYDSSGAVVARGEYVFGQKEGEWYYKIGDHTEEGNYLDGQKHGDWKHIYLNGKTNFEGSFKNGLPDGKHVYYYANGRIKEEGKYSVGKKNGDWKKYYPNGLARSTFTFKNGTAIKSDGLKLNPTFSQESE